MLRAQSFMPAASFPPPLCEAAMHGPLRAAAPTACVPGCRTGAAPMQDFVSRHGGRVFELRAGEALILPPRVFHFARNRAPTVSINASYCKFEDLPLMFVRTFCWMSAFPKPHNHSVFGPGVGRLLEAVTDQVSAAERCAVPLACASHAHLPVNDCMHPPIHPSIHACWFTQL